MASATQFNIPSFSAQLLKDRSVIRLSGLGVLGFLHNLLTCDVANLLPGQAAYGALLSPQGKILHDVFVVVGAESVLLDCATVQVEALVQKLVMYRLRAKIVIAMDEELAVAVSSAADLPGLSFADPRLSAMGYRSLCAAAVLPFTGNYTLARLQLGLADSVDLGSGVVFPHEANFDQLNGVNFSKGCYVGQEVVSRTQHRGSARSRIVPVTCEAGGPVPGTDVTSGDTRIGEMLSSKSGLGLVLLRLDKLAASTAHVMAAGVRLHVHKPAWANFEMNIPEVAA